MSLLRSLDISASALRAERLRIELISENLANVHTTRTANGEPYRRKIAAFSPRGTGFRERFARLFVGGRRPVAEGGVDVVGIYQDPRPFHRVHDPGHPDADAEGMVAYPNVDLAEEMVNLIAASRVFEANATAFNVTRSLVQSALRIGD